MNPIDRIILIGLIAILVVAAVCNYQTVKAQSNGSNLVELIGSEESYIGLAHHNEHMIYSRYHDKASGIEILCIWEGGNSTSSCVTTGRKW